MTGRTDHEEEDDHLAAARWVRAIEEGLGAGGEAAFHAWLAERPQRADLIAQLAALQDLAREAGRQGLVTRMAPLVSRLRVARRGPRGRAIAEVHISRRGLLTGGAIAAGVMAFAGGVLRMRSPQLSNERPPETAYETTTGEVRALALADTSRLWLDTRTRATVRLSHQRREVALDSGRIFVEVAHDPGRPFLVRGALFEARAVGTAFEATAFAGRTGVAVTEGVVRLTAENGGPAVDLAAGDAAWIALSGEVARSTAAVVGIGAWRERRMVLSDRPLDAALAELSRYFDRPLTVANKDLAARRVSLSFSIADLDASAAARILADAIGAEIADQANGSILLRQPERGSTATPSQQSSPH